MALFEDIKKRHIQRKANNFIDSLKSKSDKEIHRLFLNNKELQNNDIVLSYIFFEHPSLIRILPIKFQISRINSNLTMFKYGSEEAKRKLVTNWLKDNKFFMNVLVVGLSEEEYNSYLRLYFKNPECIALLYMDDLRKVITYLSEFDLKQTEEIIKSIKDKLNDRQWEFIIEVNPLFIKYATQNIQNKHVNEEKYVMYLNGEAKNKYIESQLESINGDINILENASVEIQKEYIEEHPYIINYLKDETLINLLKYDIELIKYVNLSYFKNEKDKTQEIVCSILENIESKSNKDVVNILVNKCLLNAKGKLYRYDVNSNDVSYQYTKRIIKLLQNLTIEQIVALIMVDSNYILPYIVPVYNDDTPREQKEKIIMDSNVRCLNVFKVYYGNDLYTKYYKTINKIFDEYLNHLDSYDYEKDYKCVFELLKVLFNKQIINNNKVEKVNIFIGTCLIYKQRDNNVSKVTKIKLLNELLSHAYNTNITNNREIYNINSLELFDPRLSFINKGLLIEYSKYNFVNISNLLLIIKTNKVINLFKKYYEIVSYIYGVNKESLYRTIENFTYYKEILEVIDKEELSDKELDNLTMLLSTFSNPYNITKKEELKNYDIILFKKLVNELSNIKDENIYKNLLCNYLFNKGYDDRGNSGWLEADTIKSLCDIYESNALSNLTIEGNKIFTFEEVNLFKMTKLLFSVSDFDLLITFIENIINNNVKRNIISISELFNKIKKYRVELINNTVVSLGEIENLFYARPDIVMKNVRDDIEIYTIVGQDFKVLNSTNDDGIHYECTSALKLDKNVYGYSKLINEGSIRFTEENNKTFIKLNKDNINKTSMKPEFIVIVNSITDELLKIAKDNNLKIIEIRND